MTQAWVILGKIGDILSTLPAIACSANGSKPVIVTSNKYCEVLKGIPELNVCVWDGDWQDLAGAIKFAKSKYRKVNVPATYGNSFPIQHRTPSFQLDQYLRMGVMDKWDSLSFNLPRPANAEELVKKHLTGKRHILVADQSQSSPFTQREELWKLINYEFGTTHTIIRLSEIQLEQFRDFLALYDASEVLITVETAHLHLSAYSKVPTVALVTDQPQRWHGSAWSKRFLCYCRYSDYELRKDELIQSIRSVLKGNKPIEVKPVPTEKPHGYNPGIINYGGKQLMTYRHHPDPNRWLTELVIVDAGKTYTIQAPEVLKGNSLEDCRLFTFQGKLHASYVVSQPIYSTSFTPCSVGYGELIFENDQWRIVKHLQPKIGKNDFSAQEKNWVFFEKDGLWVIYSCHPEHVVIKLSGEVPLQEYRNKMPDWKWGQIRGGTSPLPYKGDWIRFFHSQSNAQNRGDSTYHVGAMVMESLPPFNIKAISRVPILTGTDQYYHGWRHWKARVVIAYGAVENNGGWDVSLGWNDSACAMAHITPDQLNL